jgi:hypothetical protein
MLGNQDVRGKSPFPRPSDDDPRPRLDGRQLPLPAVAVPALTALAASFIGVSDARLPKVLPGISAAKVIADAERHGWRHKSTENGTADAGKTPVEVVTMWRWDDQSLHSLTLVRQGDGVRMVSAPIVTFRRGERETRDMSAAAYLSAFAAIPYAGSSPELAVAWVKDNVDRPGASITFGDAFFEVDRDTTSPGAQYRLTIAATGARPPKS